MQITINKWVDAGETGITFYLTEPIKPYYPIYFNALGQYLNKHYGDRIVEFIPAYHSCLIAFENVSLNHNKLKIIIEDFTQNYQPNHYSQSVTRHVIPVCYNQQFAPDLVNIAEKNQLSTNQVIELHYRQIYTVYSLGFIPGFAFLGHVNKQIAMPRHQIPRANIPAGSVGIANLQTGIYPKDSPGGWQIIGQTPITLYAPDKGLFSLFNVGDQVQFDSIDITQFNAIQASEQS